MTRKIQTSVSDTIWDEMSAVMEEERYTDIAEFVRQCIRDFLKTHATQSATQGLKPVAEAQS